MSEALAAAPVKAPSGVAGPALGDFDWEAIARPISSETPAGPSLRYEGTYDRVSEARREDDPSLPRGVWVRKQKRADWAEVVRTCRAALENESKDLQLAAWLSEGLLHSRGFCGLAQGLRIVGLLIAEFWDDLHPELEDGDADARAAVIDWIDDRLSVAVKLLPLTAVENSDVEDLSFSDWELALRHERERQAEALTRADFFERVAETPSGFYRNRRADLAEAIEACAKLHADLPEAFGPQAPSVKRLWETLEQIHHLVVTVLTERGEEEEPMTAVHEPEVAIGSEEEAEDAPAPEVEMAAAEPAPTVGRQIASREEAYRALSAIADYLMRVEPHSPTPYLLHRAISWRSKSFHELMMELVESPADLERINMFLGIMPSDTYE